MKELRVAGILPGLVDEPARRPAPVLDEPVAVDVAVAVDPLESAERRLAEVADEPGVIRPTPDLGQEDEVEGRRVDRAVVAREPGLGALAVPDLVDDLPRLGIAFRVVLARLQLGEHGEGVLGKLGAEEERLEARDHGVAAEDGHEPRHAGGGELASGASVLVHPEGREIGNGLAERVGQVVPGAAKLRDAQPPGRERGSDARELVAEATLGQLRLGAHAVGRRDHVRPQPPGLARLELDPVGHLRVLGLAALGQDDLRQPLEAVVARREDELVVVRLVDGDDGRWKRLRAVGIAEREVVGFDREDVREVVPDLERQVEGQRGAGRDSRRRAAPASSLR